MHSRHAMMATIDDHELSDNAWLGGAQEHEERAPPTWAHRSNAAMAVWSDWILMRERIPALGSRSR
jgi:alkaline phosphatase D